MGQSQKRELVEDCSWPGQLEENLERAPPRSREERELGEPAQQRDLPESICKGGRWQGWRAPREGISTSG